MALLWEKFVESMSQLLESYQALLELNEKKRQILISADVDRLIDITKQEEVLVFKINKCERARQEIIKNLEAAAVKTGLLKPNERLNSLTELKNLSDEKYSVRIEEIGAQLLNCVDEIKKSNTLNARLISQHLEFIEFNINILSSAFCEPTYTATPGDSQVKRRLILNTEA